MAETLPRSFAEPACDPAQFAGRLAVVTGGTSGIGAATVRALAAAGARVAFLGLLGAQGRRLEEELRAAGGDVAFHHVDVRDPAAVAAFFARLAADGRPLAYAVNAAGINHPPAPVAELDPALARDVMETNFWGVFHCLREEIALMRPHHFGRIVNVVSILAGRPAPFMAAYGASKDALLALTRTAAAEYGAEGLRVRALSPGPTDTPMFHRALIEIAGDPAKYAGGLPESGPQSADDVARAALYLLAEEGASWPAVELVLDGTARLR